MNLLIGIPIRHHSGMGKQAAMRLPDGQEPELAAAIAAAFDLEDQTLASSSLNE